MGLMENKMETTIYNDRPEAKELGGLGARVCTRKVSGGPRVFTALRSWCFEAWRRELHSRVEGLGFRI